LASESDISQNIARIRLRLAELDGERERLARELETFEQKLITDTYATEKLPTTDAPVTYKSPSRQKIDLFRRLFAGRVDVFPVRWENCSATIWMSRARQSG